MKKFKLLVFLVFIALASFAQDTLTLEQAIEIALKNNHNILISKNLAEINKNDATPGNAGMLPQLGLTSSTAWSNSNIHQRYSTGQDINKSGVGSSSSSAGIALSWTLFDGMKMFATYNKLQELSAMGEINAKISIENTLASVTIAYAEMVKQIQLIKGLENDIELYKERLKIAESKLNIGSGSKVDVLQAKVDRNEVLSNCLSQKNILAGLKFSFNQLLARPIDTEFQVSSSIAISYDPDFEDLKKSSISNNNFLLFQQKNIAVNEFALKEKQALYSPTVALNSTYNFSQTANQAGLTLLNQNLGLSAGFTVSWNIFNGLNDYRQIKNAKISVLNSKLLFDQSKLTVESTVWKAYISYKNAKEILALEEENFLLVKENLDISMERFRLGNSTSIDLKTAQKSYEDALVRITTARYNTKVAETELLRLNGMMVK
jgi:outer membrane protein